MKTISKNEMNQVSSLFAERDAIVQKALLDGANADGVAALLEEYDRKTSERLRAGTDTDSGKRAGGRPPIPKQLRRTHRFTVNLNDEELEIIAALGSEKDEQVLLRELALEAAMERLKKKRSRS